MPYNGISSLLIKLALVLSHHMVFNHGSFSVSSYTAVLQDNSVTLLHQISIIIPITAGNQEQRESYIED